MTADDLRDALAASGVSQMELARRIKVDGRTVRYWLAGRAIPESAVPEIREALSWKVCPTCGQALPANG